MIFKGSDGAFGFEGAVRMRWAILYRDVVIDGEGFQRAGSLIILPLG